MSQDLNKCMFIGRLGGDPEVKYMPSGDAVANISLACGNDYKNKQGEKVEQTDWIKVVAFGRLAEIIGEYLSKGSQVFIEGRQRTRKWQTQDGQDRYTTEIVANNMQMLGGGRNSGQGGEKQHDQPSKQQAPSGGPGDFDDDIPFAQVPYLAGI